MLKKQPSYGYTVKSRLNPAMVYLPGKNSLLNCSSDYHEKFPASLMLFNLLFTLVPTPFLLSTYLTLKFTIFNYKRSAPNKSSYCSIHVTCHMQSLTGKITTNSLSPHQCSFFEYAPPPLFI
jgi:hypothetical protein